MASRSDFIQVRGAWDNLTGNAIAFWDIRGDQDILPGATVIASNFTISSLVMEDKILTATFPPIPFNDYTELDTQIKYVHCDVFYGGELEFPDEEKDFQRFYKKELIRFNKLVQRYTHQFKERLLFHPEHLSEEEQLDLLNDWTQVIRSQIKEGSRADKVRKQWTKIQTLMEVIADNYHKYDIDNLSRILYLPGNRIDQLTHLYLQKYVAIYKEKYEEAQTINTRILDLEKVTPDDY